jgi:cytidine deaminase
MEANHPTCDLTKDELSNLFSAAWAVRENAYVIGPTRVGCAILDASGQIFSGCNVENRFRSHDVHAEVNAIGNMISKIGRSSIRAVVIAAEREHFTPCGSCMDWILQFSLDDCQVIAQSSIKGPVKRYKARELMPFYPY